MPLLSLEPLNGCLSPLFLITLGRAKSAVSNVVNLDLHISQDRLLLVCEPSETNLESMTLVSSAWQNGQYIYKL
jgi:hypothetical protein